MKRFLILLLSAFTLFLAIYLVDIFFFTKTELKIYNPIDIVPELVDESVRSVNHNHKVSSFSLVNQDNKIINRDSLAGKIVVADFFFATCKTICPKMAVQMKRVYKTFLNDPQVLLVSHSMMPEVDSVPVLKKYAEKLEVNADKWLFLTGAKEEIYKLARASYLVGLTKPGVPKPEFIHTENFVLVDKIGQIRGFYDGTSFENVNQLISDIRVLKQSYEE